MCTARPEQVNEAPVAGELFNRFLEGSHRAAADAKDVEEVVLERLAFGGLAGFALPFAAEGDGAVANLIPRQWHGERLPCAHSQTREISLREGVIDGAINMDGGLEPWVLKPPGIEPQPEGMIGETDAVEGLCFRIGTTEFRSLGVTPFIVGVLPDENRRLTSSTADTYELNCASAIAAGSYAVHIGYSLFSVEWWEQRPLPPAHTSVTPSEPPRSTSYPR